MQRMGSTWLALVSVLGAGGLFACGSDENDGLLSSGSGSSATSAVTGTNTTVMMPSSGTSSASSGDSSSASGTDTASSSSTSTTSSSSSSSTGTGGGSGSSASSASGSGGSTSSGSDFDGGSRPLTDEEAEELEAGACAGWAVEGELVPATLELIVDVSSSMALNAPGSNRTKWQVTRDALLEAIVGDGPNVGLPSSVNVGMVFYPNVEDPPSTPEEKPPETCVNYDTAVPIAPLGPPDGEQRQTLRDALNNNVQLYPGTSTFDAYNFGLAQHLLPADLPGQKFMLLITDGAPTLAENCTNENPGWPPVETQPIVDMMAGAASDEGIRTFIIGSPGSESYTVGNPNTPGFGEDNRPWMSEAAFLSGTAWAGCNIDGPEYCHFDMTEAPDFSLALAQGLGTILGALKPCSYVFPEPPQNQSIDEEEINVVLKGDDNILIIRDDVGDCSEGWQLTSDNEILLCPDTCDAVQLDPSLDVQITFGCASFGPTIN